MNRIRILFLSLVFLAVSLPVIAQAAPEIGKPAPLFSGRGSDGKTYKLSDYLGKFVVLEWYNPRCPFIRKHYDSGNMQSLQERYVGKGVIWLAIDSSAPG